MTRLLSLLALSALLLVARPRPAVAHGGAYRGPVGEIPPGSHDPEPPRPPPPGAVRPGPRVMSFDRWVFWWAFNKDSILPVRTGARAVSGEVVSERIVPALLATIGSEETHPDIRAGAILALARTPDGARHLPLFLEMARVRGGDGYEKIVAESAILALGLLPECREESRETLLALVGDRDAPMRGRCFAMVALGLLRDDSDGTFAALAARLDGSEPVVDVRVSALFAMGLVGDGRRAADLAGWFDAGAVGEAPLTALEISWVLAALGKIGDPGGLGAVERGLAHDSPAVRRAAATAMGRVLPALPAAEQGPAFASLVEFRASEKDGLASNLALMSIARVAAAARAVPAVRVAAATAVRDAFATGDRETERPWAALGLGLIGDAALADDIRPVFAKLRGEKTAFGAQALALGLLGDRRDPTRKFLLAILADRGQDKKLRGAATVALGLLGGDEARDAILKTLGEREDRDLRVDTATAAGLLGDPAAVPPLLAVLDNPKSSQFVIGATALALGRIGDERAVETLLTVLEPKAPHGNGMYPDLTRALVAVALGHLVAGDNPFARLSEDFPWRASVPALDELLTIL